VKDFFLYQIQRVRGAKKWKDRKICIWKRKTWSISTTWAHWWSLSLVFNEELFHKWITETWTYGICSLDKSWV
jgi:hypothetical protein